MKRLFLAVAMGLAIAFSAGAQTTIDEKQETAPTTSKPKTEENVRTDQGPAVDRGVQSNERSVQTRINEQEHVRGSEPERARVQEQGGNVSHSTTVFRNGRESSEHLALHRGVRDRSDVHFRVGTHDRDWWLRTYSIVLMDGCHYYLADNGCWYPAYGFDGGCNYPEGAVYCE